MEEKKMSIKEVLEITIRNLTNISVPVGLTETIGMPIMQNVGNLRQCVIFLNNLEQKEKGKKENENHGEADTGEGAGNQGASD